MPITPELGTCNAPIFVVGHQRSGTTLLRLILNAHPRIVIPPEGHVTSFLRRAEGKFGPFTDDANFKPALERLLGKERQREWGLGHQAMWDACWNGERSPGGVFQSLMGLWCAKEGKPRWGEKTPGTYRHLREVDSWFPECQVIHIIRDPRDVAVSCLTPPFSDRYDKGNEYEVALRWRDSIHRGRRAAIELGPTRYHELRYEDLTGDPETRVRALAEFLHEEFVPQMLEYHRDAKKRLPRGEESFHARTSGQVDRQRVERWRKDASEEFVMRVEGMVGREMAELGYQPSGYKPGAALRAEMLLQRLRPRDLSKHYVRPKGSRRPAHGEAS